MREMLAELVQEDLGLRLCDTARTAEEALEALLEMTSEAAPDLVLVDLSLPGMNGFELIAELLHRHPHLTTLVLSGQTDVVYARRALEAGAKGFVLKGDPLALAEGVRHVLGGGVYLSERMHAARPGACTSTSL